MSGFDFKFKSQRISENKASGLCEDHLVLICHFLIFTASFYKKNYSNKTWKTEIEEDNEKMQSIQR